MNAGVKISFQYFDYDVKKKQVLRNEGKPYTVSAYDLIWDGDFYYLTGYCDEREEVRVFRVDRIKKQPELLDEPMKKQPKGYSVTKYTQEVFRVYDTHETSHVKTIADFQSEILENSELRLSKISQLDSLEEECTKLLGQANLTLAGFTKETGLDYDSYEKRIGKSSELVFVSENIA